MIGQYAHQNLASILPAQSASTTQAMNQASPPLQGLSGCCILDVPDAPHMRQEHRNANLATR